MLSVKSSGQEEYGHQVEGCQSSSSKHMKRSNLNKNTKDLL